MRGEIRTIGTNRTPLELTHESIYPQTRPEQQEHP